MKHSNNNSIFSAKEASETAKKLRESAQMARTFEPSIADRNDGKRQAWNKTITALADRYGVSAATFQPHKDISMYSISGHDYIEGPVFIGASRFYITMRFNFDLADEGVFQEEDMFYPHLTDPRNYEGTYSELYDAIADALEEYSKTGKQHRDAMPLDIAVPSQLPGPRPVARRFLARLFARRKR